MRIGEEANFNVEITPQAPIGVVIGDNAKMDVVKAVTYIESGKKEIEKAVEDGKADFDDHAVDKTQDFDDNAVNKTNAFNQNAVNKTQDFDDNAAIKQAAVDASAAEAKQWAIGDPTEPDGYSSKYWAGQAHSELSDLQSDVAAIQDVIPSEASETNKLTDKDYVDTALALKANASNTVTTDTAQTISARKTFGDRIQRSSNIDQTSTTGTAEIQAFNVMDKDSNSVSMLNTVRSSTRNYQSMRAYNKNVASGNWMDLRVNIQDDGIGYVNIDKGASVENRNLTKSTSSKTDTYVATMGWVNDGSKSTNVVHRDSSETITGNKNFTGDLTAVTQTAGDNSTKVATTAYVENAVSASGGVPTGSILPFGGSSAPTGFLLCDGTAVSRTDYADLFDVIGTTYGSGDGSTTFNLPNLSTAVLPSTSTVDVMGNGNALAIVDDLSTEAKQHNALVVGSGTSSFTTAKVPFAEFTLANPLAVGALASNANEFGTVKKALGVSTLPEWSGLTGSITGVSVNYIIKV